MKKEEVDKRIAETWCFVTFFCVSFFCLYLKLGCGWYCMTKWVSLFSEMLKMLENCAINQINQKN